MKLKPKLKRLFESKNIWYQKSFSSIKNAIFRIRIKIVAFTFRLKLALSEISARNYPFHVLTQTRDFQISTQKHQFRSSTQNHHFRISAENRNFKIWTKILYGSQIHGRNRWWKNLRPNYLLSLLKFPNFRTRGAIG